MRLKHCPTAAPPPLQPIATVGPKEGDSLQHVGTNSLPTIHWSKSNERQIYIERLFKSIKKVLIDMDAAKSGQSFRATTPCSLLDFVSTSAWQ